MLCTWLELRAATEQFRFAEKIFRFEAFRSFHWISMFHNGFEVNFKEAFIILVFSFLTLKQIEQRFRLFLTTYCVP